MKYFHVIFKWQAKGCSVRRILNTARVRIFLVFFVVGYFWYTIFTHFLAAGENNARTLPQVVIERERQRRGMGGESCSSASVPLPLLLLSFPPLRCLSLSRWSPCALEWQSKGSSSTSSRYFLLEEFCLCCLCFCCCCSCSFSSCAQLLLRPLLLPFLHLPASHPTSRT